MNPYQIVGVIAACALVFAGVVALLAAQGVPVTVAFLVVYAVALLSMLGMQRRARQCSEGADADDEVAAARRARACAAPSAGARRRRRGAASGRPALAGARRPRVATGGARY